MTRRELTALDKIARIPNVTREQAEAVLRDARNADERERAAR